MVEHSPPRQLSLSIRLDDSATFANFYMPEASNNRMAIHALESIASGDFIYLWGQTNAGRSHLLQACCHRFGSPAVYLPLGEFIDQPASEILAGIDQMPLVILDDIHRVSDRAAWAEQLFHLYNRMQEGGNSLVVSANVAPVSLHTPLADLQSRLSAMQVFCLASLDDQQKLAILIFRAAKRGLLLSEKVASYLLTHYSRDMAEQMHLLDQLDRLSLQSQRKLTIPLVKQILFDSGIKQVVL